MGYDVCVEVCENHHSVTNTSHFHAEKHACIFKNVWLQSMPQLTDPWLMKCHCLVLWSE